MGRAGSTLVHDALCSALAAVRFPYAQRMGRQIVRGYAWSLGDTQLRNGVVYKTHALARELPSDSKARVIFLYGKASDTVVSVLSCKERYGAGWIDAHFEHMRARGPLEELTTKDVLRLEEQLDGWLSARGHPVLGLRYETLWDNVGILSAFVGFPVTLPPKMPRASTHTIEEAAQSVVVRSYAALDERIDALPDYVLVE